MSYKLGLGIDIGGTNIKAGLFDAKGKLLTWRSISSQMDMGRNHVVARIGKLVAGMRRKHRLIPVIGIVVAGIINKRRTHLIHSPNLPGWDNFEIRRSLSRTLQCRVVLENDANGAALGELWKGVGKNHKDFMLLTLGTGLGSGLVMNGKLWIGEEGAAAEMGHTKVVPNGRKCGCGAKGCLERYFSNGAIELAVKRALRSKRNTRLRDFPLSEAVSPKTVYKAAQAGDAVALSIFCDISRYLGIAIANVINLLDIRTFVLSGGISNASPILIPFLKDEVNKNLFFPFSKTFKIIKAKLGTRAGATGACYLALKRHSQDR
jgi:glucokinase